MRIINRITGKVYTDLAELLSDERLFAFQGCELSGYNITYEYGWRVTVFYTDVLRTKCNFPLPPDRFTVCPDDCVTKEEVRQMTEEMKSELAKWSDALDSAEQIVEFIANKCLREV